jgi:death-on-curing protein
MNRRATEPTWLTRVVLDAVHTDQVREHGGLFGVRDETALESALARPRHKWFYDRSTDLSALAAAYAFAISANHPYCDGNKRAALLAMLTFLSVNGHDLDASDEEVLTTMLALAAGRLAEQDLAGWIRARIVPLR